MLGTHINNKTQLKIARESFANQQKMMDKQNSWNLDQWNRENAYNSPLEQRKRLDEAGLNPNFFGLDGNSGTTGLTSSDGFASPVPQTSNPLAGMAQAVGNIPLIRAQLENIKADTAKKQSEADTNNLLRDGLFESQNLTVKLLSSELERQPKVAEQLQSSINKLNAETDVFVQQAGLVSQQKTNLVQQYEINEFNKEIEHKLKEKEYDYLSAQEKAVAQNVAISWFKAQTERKAVEFHIEYGKKIYDITIPYLGKNMEEQQKILINQRLISDDDRSISRQTLPERVQAVYVDLDQKRENKRLTERQADYIEGEISWQPIDHMVNILSAGFSGAGKIIGSFPTSQPESRYGSYTVSY